ncbi:ELWxxDGT repeat protein [Flavobacterium ajazii]|uniref:ELWxxDGT repeat protein n=1 Tax=Flavobacterium ajazii TaxID=2692318 RepID=UPI0013D8BD45|nr:ELWxxDGT repeat protein [Flavobacterium ajazii]
MKNKYLFLLLISALSFGQIVQVKDIYPGSTNSVANSSSPSTFFDYNGILYFRANNGTDGVELWKSDGTDAGTVLVKNINNTSTLASASNPSNFTIFNNQLYFSASNGTTVNSTELWKTDGTPEGTNMVIDINKTSTTAVSNSNPQLFTIINPTTLLFSATDGLKGTQLWKTNGTEAGTSTVFDSGTGNTITWMENLNGIAIYGQITTGQGRELYSSDGNSVNSRIKDIYSGTPNGVGTSSFRNGNTVYFPGNTSANGSELWKTDGTEAGTVLVKDINPGTTASAPVRFANSGNLTYFKANGPNGQELWRTDGTEAGTVEVANINTAADGSSNPDQIVSINDVIYFFAADNGTNYDLYKYENDLLTKLYDFNALTGTVSTNYVELNGKIYFAADSNSDGSRELWQTDGTALGTVAIAGPTNILELTKVGNKLFFAGTVADGQELFSYTPPTLSVKDQDKLEAVAVYPNPSDGNFFINNTDNETIQYEVFDLLGKKQAAGQTNDNSLHLNLKTGLYILKLTKNSQTSTTKIIIK